VATFGSRRLQRKNMNPTCNVDLNRNYPTAFGQGTPSSCNAETYPGKMALSEPESQAVASLIGSLARPALMIDYHSTAAQVMIPYAYTTRPPPDLENNQRCASCIRPHCGRCAAPATRLGPATGWPAARGAGSSTGSVRSTERPSWSSWVAARSRCRARRSPRSPRRTSAPGWRWLR
jgi:hypothetical protein